MEMSFFIKVCTLVLLCLLFENVSIRANSIKSGATFHCLGNCDEPQPPRPEIAGGSALLGGHMYPGVMKQSDVFAYRWLLDRSRGGDIVVLTADDDPCDIYNSFLLNQTGTIHPPNSVTTICFTSRDGAKLDKTTELLQQASVVFITGGDQAKYYQFWQDTPVSKLLASTPLVGGSSAGLAVQGHFVFTALKGSVDSQEALEDPTTDDITIAADFLSLPWMQNIITDTHFYQRDRMGRLVAFLARIESHKNNLKRTHNAHYKNISQVTLGIGISEHSALLLDHLTGAALTIGLGPL